MGTEELLTKAALAAGLDGFEYFKITSIDGQCTSGIMVHIEKSIGFDPLNNNRDAFFLAHKCRLSVNFTEESSGAMRREIAELAVRKYEQQQAENNSDLAETDSLPVVLSVVISGHDTELKRFNDYLSAKEYAEKEFGVKFLPKTPLYDLVEGKTEDGHIFLIQLTPEQIPAYTKQERRD